MVIVDTLTRKRRSSDNGNFRGFWLNSALKPPQDNDKHGSDGSRLQGIA
jgi:hypothetical protein